MLAQDAHKRRGSLNLFGPLLMPLLGLFLLDLGAGDARAQWTQSGSSIYYNGGNVGIGITNPQGTLHIVESVQPGMFIDGYTIVPLITFRAANGTVSSPTSVVNGTILGDFLFRGYVNGTGFTTTSAGAIIRATAAETWTSSSNGAYLSFFTALTGAQTPTVGERMRIDPFGNVGIGTTTPAALLDVNGGFVHTTFNSGMAGVVPQTNSNGGLTVGWNASNANAEVNFYNVYGGATTAFEFSQLSSAGAVSNLMTISGGGNVGITGTLSSGSISSSGNITANSGTISGAVVKATYQDVAEWVPAAGALPAGTVVVLDKSHANQVTASAKAYDTSVAGVISASPGVALGQEGQGKLLVATTGRVRVQVDASAGAIEVGDLLVTSDKPGLAMKSEPIDVGGAKIHRPGTLIGKALEPLGHGTGEILVLLSLQ